jgi:hypothetical protein
LAYHLAAVIADYEQCKVNLKRWQTRPTLPNLIRLLAADGVLILDIGSV